MSDGIRKVIADALDNVATRFELPNTLWHSQERRNWCVNVFVNALHAAGYEIVPGWSDNLGAAPRDGTFVDVYSPRHGVAVANAYSGEQTWFDLQNGRSLPDITHWRLRPSPPKES